MGKHLRLKTLNQAGFDHVFAAVACFVAVALVGTYLLVASHASPWKGLLEVSSQNSGYCLTATGTATGSTVVLDPCSKTYNAKQVWQLNDIRVATVWSKKSVQEFTLQSAAGNNECLNDWQQSRKNNTQMRLYPCSSATANLWVWGVKFGGGNNSHLLANLATSSTGAGAVCLDDQKGSHVAGTHVNIYTCKGTNQSNQLWFEHAAPSSSSAPAPTPTPTPPTPSPTPKPTSSVSCNYQVDTWSGDASKVGYSATKVSATNGNPASFSVKLNANKGTTEVVGYPSAQCLMYSALPSTLTSSFNDTLPASSSGLDYEYAYDIWLTTASAAQSNNWNNDLELMIWNYVNGQVPAGSVKATLPDGSKVWVAGNNSTGTVSVVLPKNETSGSVNISSIVSQLKTLGYVNNSYNGILDVEYGIEAPYGGGQTFTVNSLSISE